MGERVEDVHSGLVTVSGHDAGSGLFVVGTHSRMGERVEDAGSGLLAGLLWTGTHSRILISALPGFWMQREFSGGDNQGACGASAVISCGLSVDENSALPAGATTAA